MSEHERIRELLALAGAGVLTSAEEKQVVEHVRSCIACSSELEAWQAIASDLRRLPTPQPSPRLVAATVARAELRLAEQAEHASNRRVMILVVAFAWLMTVASWAVFHFASLYIGTLLGPQFIPGWISFTAFYALGWMAGGVAVVMLAVRQPSKRRLA